MLPVEGDGRARERHVPDHQTSSIWHPGRIIGGNPALDALALYPCLCAEKPPAGMRLGVRGSLCAQAVWCGADWPHDNPLTGLARNLNAGLALAMLDAPTRGDEPTAATA
jgi:hypothetical protein